MINPNMGFIGTLQKSRFWWVKVYIDCVGKSVDDIAAKIEEKLRSSKARGSSGHG